jgi:hypothetical protein
MRGFATEALTSRAITMAAWPRPIFVLWENGTDIRKLKNVEMEPPVALVVEPKDGHVDWPSVIEALMAMEEEYLGVVEYEIITVPPEIGLCLSLTCLELSYNHLETLPDELGDLANLRTLYLDHNRLRALPASLGRLPSLDLLYIHSNQLKWIPDEIFAAPIAHAKVLLNPWQFDCEPTPVGSELVPSLQSLSLQALKPDLVTSLPEELRELVGKSNQCAHCRAPCFVPGRQWRACKTRLLANRHRVPTRVLVCSEICAKAQMRADQIEAREPLELPAHEAETLKQTMAGMNSWFAAMTRK